MNPSSVVKYVENFADILNGEFELTRGGVPRIIMRGSQFKISLVYMARARLWKAFFPFPADVQERVYFKTNMKMLEFLKEKGCRFENEASEARQLRDD